MSNERSKRAPALFIGHGSPMNAIESNAYTAMLGQLGRRIGKPKSILVVSAHWTSLGTSLGAPLGNSFGRLKGTWVTHMAWPRTIHDFYGFPKPLFDVKYAAPGSPELAEKVQKLVEHPAIELDDKEWGLDHGTWAVLKHLYPEADVPVVQLSIDLSQPGQFHLELGRKLAGLRNEGVMILGSGNIVHNLREINWEPGSTPYPWAVEFDAWVKGQLTAKNFNTLADDFQATKAARMSVPTTEHYLPLLYVLGAADPDESAKFEYESLEMGSLSMLSVSFGAGS